jgi:hypothetical protein
MFIFHILIGGVEREVSSSIDVLTETVQFEQGNEKDDGDPYVCFRRRDVRQVRKTRRTDSQSTDKLKKIRQDFETARGLIKDVLQREQMRKTAFLLEKQIFEQRRTAIELKRKLNIKDTDEDLINKVISIFYVMEGWPVLIRTSQSVFGKTSRLCLHLFEYHFDRMESLQMRTFDTCH